MGIEIYADKECKTSVKTISWNEEIIINLVTGEKKILPNTSIAGETATAVIYLKNNGDYSYAITKVSFPDKRLSLKFDKGWLEPNEVAQLIISFTVPDVVTPDSIVKAGKIEIEGYYVYGE